MGFTCDSAPNVEEDSLNKVNFETAQCLLENAGQEAYSPAAWSSQFECYRMGHNADCQNTPDEVNKQHYCKAKSFADSACSDALKSGNSGETPSSPAVHRFMASRAEPDRQLDTDDTVGTDPETDSDDYRQRNQRNRPQSHAVYWSTATVLVLLVLGV